VRSGRSVMKVISSVSSALVVLTGVYLTWYWYVAITQRTNPGKMVEIVGRWQSMLVRAMSDVGALALSATLTVVIIGILAVSVRRD